MSQKAKYVTQASTYDRLLIGKRLTDRRITQLQNKGHFGGRRRRPHRRPSVDKLLKHYNL